MFKIAESNKYINFIFMCFLSKQDKYKDFSNDWLNYSCEFSRISGGWHMFTKTSLQLILSMKPRKKSSNEQFETVHPSRIRVSCSVKIVMKGATWSCWTYVRFLCPVILFQKLTLASSRIYAFSCHKWLSTKWKSIGNTLQLIIFLF